MFEILGYGLGVTLILAVLFVRCEADPAAAERALEAQGLVEVELGGYPWFKCGREDGFNSRFTARSPNGRRVTGAVCCGWFKGCTVRTD